MDEPLHNSSDFPPPSPVLDRFCRPDNGTSLPNPALTNLKWTFRCIMVAISLLGVAGNVLNLVTLRSPSLRNVPFMFIRALALFDLVSLAAILLHFVLDSVHINLDPDVLINSFLVAGLYCAVLLTIERYLLIRNPFTTGVRLLSIENTVLVKIGFALLVAVLLHSPMALQNKAKCTRMEAGECAGRWAKGNNVDLLCHQPAWTLFNYYKMGRECLRFFCVLLLIVLNAKVARSLQVAKRNRRLLIKRVSLPPEMQQPQLLGLPFPGGDLKGGKRELNSLMRSFTEKKLTALMIAICVIFAFGNIPQMVDLLCHQPAWTLFNYYKMGRECLRFFCVLLLIVLNAKVARSLQVAKRNRRLLIKRVSLPPEMQQPQLLGLPFPGGDLKGGKRELNSLMRSFTEKKLTALMIAICVIFAFGNIPQMVVMEHSYNFQVFRQLANTAEVLNHCLNFFIFCMASSEYRRAFLSLSPIRCLLRRVPLCASFVHVRLNGHFESTPLACAHGTSAATNATASNSNHFGAAQQQSFKSGKASVDNGRIVAETPPKERTNSKWGAAEGPMRGNKSSGNSPHSVERGNRVGGKTLATRNRGSTRSAKECLWQQTAAVVLIGEGDDDFL
uniref:G_PROTEIN_RECEP_F1_2 domain-containing protein n=1 Tax=Globodera pallida TaxID=36090 RepID=A0A183BJC5_GLOPA